MYSVCYFNPRPREEGDTPLAEPTSVPISISIHALVKRATEVVINNKQGNYISIHALVKRATIICAYGIVKACSISIHALVKRATRGCLPHAQGILYFNPRPREEGDRSKCTLLLCFRISIHALVKRATALQACAKVTVQISIHALVKRATTWNRSRSSSQEFQSTPS